MANCSSTEITEVSSNQKKLLENIHRIVTKTVLSLFVVNLRQSDWFLKISKTASMHSSHQKSCRLQNKKKIDKIYSTGTNTKNDIVWAPIRRVCIRHPQILPLLLQYLPKSGVAYRMLSLSNYNLYTHGFFSKGQSHSFRIGIGIVL